MKGLKKVYYYIDVDKNIKSPYFQKRNEALAWYRENKDGFDKMLFLYTGEMTKKRYNEYFSQWGKMRYGEIYSYIYRNLFERLWSRS